MLSLALAVLMPPHARVNTQCNTVWNADRTNLDVVWQDKRYPQPWVFNVQPGKNESTCTKTACVSRLWCTDSGAVGYFAASSDSDMSTFIEYTWLMNLSVSGRRTLRQSSGTSTLSTSSAYGPGTVAVVGDVLYFYTSQFWSSGTYGQRYYPHLAALQFRAYSASATADKLVVALFEGLDLTQYAGSPGWRPMFAPIYPADTGSVVVSFAGSGGNFAVDNVVEHKQSHASVALRVHYTTAEDPFAVSMVRSVVTSRHYSCRAPSGQVGTCFVLDDGGAFTWAPTFQEALGRRFVPMAYLPSFALPASFYAPRMVCYSVTAPVLATFGQRPAVWFDGAVLHAVETVRDTQCASGSHYAAVTRSVPDTARVLATRTVACTVPLRFPEASRYDAPYQANAVKWAPGSDTVLVALDTERGQYAEATSSPTCQEGSFAEGGRCLPCPAGFFCPGPLDSTQDRRRCPPGSHTPREGMAKCAVSAGYYFRFPGAVQLCERGFFCPGDIIDHQPCPASRPHSAEGASRESQCHA